MRRNRRESVLTVVYCRICQHELFGYGELPLSLYQTICEFYVLNQRAMHFRYKASDRWTSSALRFLETKGFITTVDDEDGILAKPVGHEERKKNIFEICARRDEHL